MKNEHKVKQLKHIDDFLVTLKKSEGMSFRWYDKTKLYTYLAINDSFVTTKDLATSLKANLINLDCEPIKGMIAKLEQVTLKIKGNA